MQISWVQLRYRLALAVSVVFALLTLSGLGMGGPRGDDFSVLIGWTAVLAFSCLPIVVWYTKDHPAARNIQMVPLVIAALALVYFVVVARTL